ncbi:substrate-binding domain-containing protein [Gallibacterium anatis]|uniref:Ribose operon repressor n=5 Tax=Gallibacterium TaxID=155493 RepID=A0A0A2Z2U1_9PAST|nr:MULTISPECIES: substrate-binding domain-containing protein [Gallibacterium]AEC17541.1 transcriptional repressor RbsR [Gallibacterium anatis UMN179]ERF79326.1 LacI family transcriptional regulator [Gallibacterium anatis 12656/12]KGQ28825.1 transcriptional regulator [Gallibacterium anatis]KGQ29709.1 transcriptional regulator [Gallibacterium anatis]KGQ34452.1 transcriptional regulator [Gallibacterium genomosp. 2]
MATMKDIARIAKVSTSTVSHVINNTRYVSDEIREKIMKVVNELNYTPSAVARSLKVKETKTLGMLVTATSNPFFAEVVSGVEQYCNQHHYNLIISSIDGNEQRLQQNIQTLIQKQVDGLLLMYSDTRHAMVEQLNLNLPIVVMDWWPTELNADKIYENSEFGAYLATKTLIEQGHKNIAIITGKLDKSLAHNRLLGYQKALQDAHLPINPDWIIESHFDFEGGVEGMKKLLQITPRPTAVFACSDTIAVGVYQVAWQQGLRIPQDISVIGYDNIMLAQYLTPPLTTIHQPKAELGKLAVETLLERIKSPDLEYKTTMLQPQLIWRASVAKI